MSKLGTNLIVAVFAFIFGVASASTFNKFNLEEQANAVVSTHLDAMGNIKTTQD